MNFFNSDEFVKCIKDDGFDVVVIKLMRDLEFN